MLTWRRRTSGRQLNFWPKNELTPQLTPGILDSRRRCRSLFTNCLYAKIVQRRAKVAELADAPDLGSGGGTRGGSRPPFRTIKLQGLSLPRLFLFSPKFAQ